MLLSHEIESYSKVSSQANIWTANICKIATIGTARLHRWLEIQDPSLHCIIVGSVSTAAPHNDGLATASHTPLLLLLLLLLLLGIPHLPLCLWLSLCPNSWVELVGLSPLSASTHITSFKEIHKIPLLSKTIDFLTIKAISTKIIESLTRCLWKVGGWELLTIFCQMHKHL